MDRFAKGERAMLTLNLDDAQARLREILAGLQPGEEIVLTDNGQPLAKLVKTERTSWPCEPGSAKDSIHWISPDFDAPLEEFKEYME
jgi:antitoxin (DNA-binding transcriptional repressor) of toxin-antitoxin stability system